MTDHSYFHCFSSGATRQDHPTGSQRIEISGSMSTDGRHAHQNARFCQALAFAWKVSCYGSLWHDEEIEPGDFHKLLVDSKDDLMPHTGSDHDSHLGTLPELIIGR